MSESNSRTEGRAATGVTGLDEILGGGLVRDRTYLIEGHPGTGKTTLSIQFLLEGVVRGEPGMLVTHSETREEMLQIGASHGWDLSRIHVHEWRYGASTDAEGYTLFDAAEIELGESIAQLLARLDELRPKRLAFDSIVGLRVLSPNDFFYRRQLQSLREFFVDRACTTLMIDDSPTGDPRAQTLAHGVLQLHMQAQEYGPSRRRLQVLKMRGAPFLEGYHDFVIRRGGVEVYPRLVASSHGRSFDVGIASSGIPDLDDLLGGGIERGTSTLVLGPAGVGKSTVLGMYAVQAAQRGERAHVLLFDEVERTWCGRLAGLGFDPTTHLESGAVTLQRVDPAELSSGAVAHSVRDAVESGATLVALDSLNGYLEVMAEERHATMHLRELLTFLNQEGVTTLLTMSQHGILGSGVDSAIDLSFLADTVLLLRYFEADGEVRQALSVLKKRSGRHERTIRELKIAPGGVVVGPPLRQFAGVLSGVPRFRGPDQDLLEPPKLTEDSGKN